MGKIFNKKKTPEVQMAQPPVSQETPGEVKEIERLSGMAHDVQQPATNINPVAEQVAPKLKDIDYREIPMCMSKEQIYNLVIENNIMLKQIISEMDD